MRRNRKYENNDGETQCRTIDRKTDNFKYEALPVR